MLVTFICVRTQHTCVLWESIQQGEQLTLGQNHPDTVKIMPFTGICISTDDGRKNSLFVHLEFCVIDLIY